MLAASSTPSVNVTDMMHDADPQRLRKIKQPDKYIIHVEMNE